MDGITTHPWDITESLDRDERVAAYLEAALEDIARAKDLPLN